MSEFRKHTGGYVVLPNETVNDRTLSFRARGVLAYLIGRPPGWRFAADRIAQDGVEGREAVQAALRELRRAGYYRVARKNTGAGFLTVTEVAATPGLMPEMEAGFSALDAAEKAPPGVGFPDAG